jgi:hypothetical protein
MMNALAVIGQYFDDPALRDTAVAASFHHQFQLGLESGQAADTLLDFGEARLRDGVRACAGLAWFILQSEKCADRIDLEPQLARVVDEGQTAQIGRCIMPAVPLAAGWRGQ